MQSQFVYQPGLDHYDIKDVNGKDITVYNSSSENMKWPRGFHICVCNHCNVAVKTTTQIEDPLSFCLVVFFGIFIILCLPIIGCILYVYVVYNTNACPLQHVCPVCKNVLGSTKTSKWFKLIHISMSLINKILFVSFNLKNKMNIK